MNRLWNIAAASALAAFMFVSGLLAGDRIALASSVSDTAGRAGAAAETEENTETEMKLTAAAASVAETERQDTASDVTLPDTTEALLNSDPETAPAPQISRPQEPDTEYRKVYEYSSDVLFSGIFKKNTYSFAVKDYWEPVYAYAQIQYTVSPLIENVPASMTFYVNDTPVDSFRIEYGDGGTKTAFVEIPVSLLNEGYNNFSITGYVRLYDEEGCLDDFSGANWVCVSQDSLIEAGYDLKDTEDLLRYYPFPFVSSIDENGEDCGIYVPDDADNSELEAALLLRANLGNETAERDDVSFGTFSGLSDSGKKNRIYVAASDRLPDEVRAKAPDDLTSSGGAAVFEYDEDGGTVLVVTAENSSDLYEASAMLMDESRVIQESGRSAFVPSGTSDIVVQNSKLSDLTVKETAIKDIINEDGLEFIGPFRQEQTIYLTNSGGFTLGEGGKITLNYRYSDNLDFTRSLLTVYWGDTPVASRKLTAEGASGDSFSFTMPQDVVGTNEQSIRIAFDLEIQDLYCTKRADQMPWAYVSGDSTLYLPAGSGSALTLDLRPYPLEKLGLYNDLTVVVPDSLSSVTADLLGRAVALYGTSLSPYGDLEVIRASEAASLTGEKNGQGDESQTEGASAGSSGHDRNILTVGIYAENAFLQDMNGSLSFAYTDSGDAVKSNEQALLSDSYARKIGTVQIIRSPWSDGRAVVAFSAPDRTAEETMLSWLRSSKHCYQLTGDACIIDGTDKCTGYTFLKQEQEKQMSLKENIERNRPAVILTLISTLAMAILLSAVIILMVRYYRNRKQDEKR